MKIKIFLLGGLILVSGSTFVFLKNNRNSNVDKLKASVTPTDNSISTSTSNQFLEDKLDSQKQSPDESDLALERSKSTPSKAEFDAMSLDEYIAYRLEALQEAPPNVQSAFYEHMAKSKAKYEALGFFSDDQKEPYKAYNREQLETLAEAGDLIALDVLARIYLEDRNFSKAASTHYRAVLFGSAKSAGSLAIHHESKSQVGIGEPENEDIRELYTALAWYKIANLMGDQTAESTMRSSLRVKGVSLSQNEWDFVDAETKRIWQQLNTDRNKLGVKQLTANSLR